VRFGLPLSRRHVAALLGVDERWVRRHLSPTLAPTRTGASWYLWIDLEAQLVRRSGNPRPREQTRTTPAMLPAARRVPATNVPPPPAVDQIERRLRARVAEPAGAPEALAPVGRRRR
jgi:hypothetical protein